MKFFLIFNFRVVTKFGKIRRRILRVLSETISIIKGPYSTFKASKSKPKTFWFYSYSLSFKNVTSRLLWPSPSFSFLTKTNTQIQSEKNHKNQSIYFIFTGYISKATTILYKTSCNVKHKLLYFILHVFVLQ